MNKLSRKTWRYVAIGLGVSGMIGGALYWLFDSWEIAIAVSVIPLHYFLRDAIGTYYALRRDVEERDTSLRKKKKGG